MAPHAKYSAVYNTDFLRAQRLSGDASSRTGPMVEIHDVSEPNSGTTVIFGFIGVPAKSRWTVSEDVLKLLCREQLVRLFGPDAAEPEAEFLKDWASDPFTATEFDLLQESGHPLPDQPWTGKNNGDCQRMVTAVFRLSCRRNRLCIRRYSELATTAITCLASVLHSSAELIPYSRLSSYEF
jgi:hypothetical protein